LYEEGFTMLKAIDPSSGKLLREVPCEDSAACELALSQAVAAGSAWRALGFTGRGERLRAVAALLRNRSDLIAGLMAEEMGKPIKEGHGEVEKSAWCAEHYAEHAETYLAPIPLASDATKSWVQHLPLGVLLGILPWNAPMWLALRFAAPALMAGNTCLLKHDPNIPGSAAALGDVFREAGLATGVARMVFINNEQVEPLIRDERVRAISFTGSSRAGSFVAGIAASEIKPAVLELGGSDPCVVLADADLDAAADAISLSRIINAGQSCIAAKRIIVEASVHDALVERLFTRLARLRLGDPRDSSTDVGPIARADLRDNLHRQVRSTIDQGARCLLGGQVPNGPGFFYPVTLLTEVTPAMTAFCEETFGPVAVVIRAKDEDHAVLLANDTPYGLAASVWTATNRGIALSEKIEAGQVVVNGVVKTDPRLPSGGIKRSGYGRELGPHGIHQFVNVQQVWVGPKK
jgi:succinate-semialdehyde dehydrogenase/glutarate-semialdehyde dehydrogenase